MRKGNMSWIKYFFVGFLLPAALLFIPVSGWTAQKGSEEVVKKMNNALLESMKQAEQIGFRGRYKLLSPVIRDIFALNFMGQVALGSYWKGLSPEQKKQYLDTYSDWTVSSYAGNFDGYSGEKFEIASSREEGGNQEIVISRLLRPKEDSIDFHYTLRRLSDKWRIVDIRIEGVSQLALTRGQFVSVMKKKGFDGLIASLKDKISVLRSKDQSGK
jgi:phospholipid transport system substrate-binding protein